MPLRILRKGIVYKSCDYFNVEIIRETSTQSFAVIYNRG